MGSVAILILNSALLGVGLAMDAFSVSLANGLREPTMGAGRTFLIAGTFGFFQALMPLTGWLCVRTVAERFTAFQPWIPWISLALLLYLGATMILDGCHSPAEDKPLPVVSLGGLLLQGIATSVDALSLGFTIAGEPLWSALISALVIAAVTLVICLIGLRLGKNFGTRLAGRASILGGLILIAIGIEIFVHWLTR